MIDICAFFEYTTNVSRGKMVTIHRKNLLASCLFLLGYSSFFLLAVSGFYDYTASGVFARSLEPSKPGKHRNEWLSNHEWDYSSLKGNYHWRRKSRSTLENETSRVEGARIEETGHDAGGEWVPRKERTVERFVGPESIGNASGFVQEEKEKEDSDAIKNTTIAFEPIENDINIKNETKKEVSNDEKKEQNNNLTNEVSSKEEKNATDILQFRSIVPRFSTELGQEGPDDVPKNEGYPTQRWRTSLKIHPKEFLKKIFRRKDHRHRNGEKKGGVSDIEFEDSKDYDEDFEEKEEEVDEDGEDEKEEKDLEESSTVTGLYKIISDMFLPIKNDSVIGRYPWKALTSSKYTKRVTKQEGPHLKETTKETKSKMSLFFANNLSQTSEIKNNSTNEAKIEDFELSRTDRPIENSLSERMESMDVTSQPEIKITTNGQVDITTTEPIESLEKKECDSTKKNIDKSWIFDEKTIQEVTIYRILDTKILLVARILDLRDQPIIYWY